ncbi:unnamed protein product [Coregonus sp. 'balchen']|nr:unnamed protein product [Coregonus sp. 'balchen']
MLSWFFCILLLGLRVTESQASGLAPPQQVRLDADKAAQKLSVTWEDGHASTFDVEILRTELMEIVLNETVGVTADQSTGKHQWNWTSPVPLECTSLSVKVRSRDGQDVSEWSSQQILPGLDLPDNAVAQMYPEGKTVPVGSDMTFCCIVEEGQQFGNLWYKTLQMNETMLSRRTYATTMTIREPSNPSGTNVVCSNEKNIMVTGAVVFVGYPPLPSDLVCETHDLISVDCQWTKGRNTYLFGKTRQTYYTLNGRNCTKAKNSNMHCGWEQWEGNWTLVARNPLGQFRLTDAAQLGHRVRPVAPVNLTTPEVYSWNASVGWHWNYNGYERLSLICQVQRSSHWNISTQTYTGHGLNTAVLKDLQPDEEYSVKVRCGSQKNFWKWGEWSLPLSFQTKMDHTEDTTISKVAFNGSGFPLSWVAQTNASCGYVVDWYNTSCTQDCSVEWTKVAADNTNTVVQSKSTVLLERWHGYMQELAYWLILELLVALGAMTCGTLDVKPSPHSMVHIVEDPVWDSSKEALVSVPEEDEEGTGDEAADTDEPAVLRYYNQVVEEGSSSRGRPHASDSSASSASSTGSMDSGHTDVTYTGIQTSACSLAHFQPQPDASQCAGDGGYRPQMQSASCPEDPQAGPEEHLQPPVGSFGGYQPQCSWKQDSPEADGGLDQAYLGSPTSVTSSQFLLPHDTSSEEGKEHPSSASTWFHNLLTGKP